MRRFEHGLAGGGSAEFLDWMRRHPEGLFINRVSLRKGTLHRADCGHMNFPEPEVIDFVSRPKIADRTRAALEDWARRNNVKLRVCSDCRA